MTGPLPVPKPDAAAAPAGNARVTRQHWLDLALDVLVSDGIERVKVLTLAARMGVSRSSFYWYFRSRQDLLDALLRHWQDRNTAALVAQAEAPAETVTGAVCNVFRCTVDPDLFDTRLDFAVRDWARRSGRVRNLLDRSDARRIEALRAMFARYGYREPEALARARVLHSMQLGDDMARPDEPPDQRLAMVPHYLRVIAGREPRPAEIEAFNAAARGAWGATKGKEP